MFQLATEKRFHVERVMGTVVSFDLRDPGAAGEQAVEAAVRWLHEVDAEFSTYRPDSAVSRYGRGELTLGATSERLRWVIDQCERLKHQTNGSFDACARGSFDPSALVKGWAVQHAAESLRSAGALSFCITAGGDVAVSGRPDSERAWSIGIRHPRDPMALAGAIDAEGELAVATSGLYERGDHIVDPRTRQAPAGVLSVTIVGPDLGLADAYATAAFAMGTDGPEWTLGLEGYESMTILENDSVLTTPGFPAFTQ
jgi:thiamine biosynthesis lipoprotein